MAVVTGDVILESQLAFDLDQILDVHARAESMAAAAAVRQFLGSADVLVEPDAKLREQFGDLLTMHTPLGHAGSPPARSHVGTQVPASSPAASVP